MRITKSKLRRIIRESIVAAQSMPQGDGSIEVYDGQWAKLPNEAAALEWSADQLENDYYGRTPVKPDGAPTPFAYINRYTYEIGSSGPLMCYCNTKEECEVMWQSALDDI